LAISIDVIDDAGGAQGTSPQAFAAERLVTQNLCTQGSPRGAVRGQGTFLLSLPLPRIAVPLAAIAPVRIAVARCRQHRTATGVPAGRWRSQGHSYLSAWEDLAS